MSYDHTSKQTNKQTEITALYIYQAEAPNFYFNYEHVLLVYIEKK